MTIDAPADLGRALLDPEHASKLHEVPVGVWLECLRDFPETSFAMAHSRETPREVLAAIAIGPDVRSRSRLAMRADLDPELVRVLAGDPDSGVVGHASCHRNATQQVLEALATHPWAKVRDRALDRLRRRDYRRLSPSSGPDD